jgi:Na+/H+ antiporter NhaC
MSFFENCGKPSDKFAGLLNGGFKIGVWILILLVLSWLLI